MSSENIITIGFCPSWDITCYAAGIDWGQHKRLSFQNIMPAGKALNVSRALAYIGRKSTAAGLWGQDDFDYMNERMAGLREWIDIKFTLSPGRTRQNVTVVDTKGKRQMHLRAPAQLAEKMQLMRLGDDLSKIVSEDSICVFAGSMPADDLENNALSVIQDCASVNAKIVVDSSGSALDKIVQAGGLWIIKPNVEELRNLVKVDVEDEAGALIEAGRTLLGKSELVLISRGAKGALVVSDTAVVVGRAGGLQDEVINTVGCGDYLLAGFVAGMIEKNDLSFALEKAIKLATLKAMGWTEKNNWPDVADKVQAVTNLIDN